MNVHAKGKGLILIMIRYANHAARNVPNVKGRQISALSVRIQAYTWIQMLVHAHRDVQMVNILMLNLLNLVRQ